MITLVQQHYSIMLRSIIRYRCLDISQIYLALSYHFTQCALKVSLTFLLTDSTMPIGENRGTCAITHHVNILSLREGS